MSDVYHLPSSLYHVPKKVTLASWNHLWREWVSNFDLLGCGMRLTTLYSFDIFLSWLGVSVAGENETQQVWNQEEVSAFTVWALPFLTWYKATIKILGRNEVKCESVEDGGETDLWWGLPSSSYHIHWGVNLSCPNLGLHANQRRPGGSQKHNLTCSLVVSQGASEEEDGIFCA